MDTDSFAPRGPAVAELSQALDGADVPEPQPTGNPEVDAALDRLRELGERSTGAHADLYDDVHQRLQTVLARIDQQPGAAAL
jgi:hypothetical protein